MPCLILGLLRRCKPTAQNGSNMDQPDVITIIGPQGVKWMSKGSYVCRIKFDELLWPDIMYNFDANNYGEGKLTY